MIEACKTKSQVQVSKEFNIARGTLCGYLKDKVNLLKQFEQSTPKSANRKRHREGKEADIEEALFIWFNEKRVQGAMPSGGIIREKAKQIAASQGKEFNASEGWLAKFKLRFNIRYKQSHGEKQSADHSAAEKYLNETLPELIKDYLPKNVYNGDEFGLYPRGLPDRGHVNGNENPTGLKMSKDRVTGLIYTNMDGSDKRRITLVGKSQRPRCFPKDLTKLPLRYYNSANAWITGALFEKDLLEWDRELRLENREILLLVDNCSAHPEHLKQALTNIRLEFLPPNTTSIVQPCDMGIIRNVKGFYRSKLHIRIITELDTHPEKNLKDVIKTISLLDTVHLLNDAWECVKPETIQNCWRKGGFKVDDTLAGAETDALHDVPLPPNMDADTFEALVSVDDDLATVGELTNEELFAEAAVARASKRQKPDNNNEGDDEEEEEEEHISNGEVVTSLRKLRTFTQKQGMSATWVKEFFSNMEREMLREITMKQKQTTIQDHFTKTN